MSKDSNPRGWSRILKLSLDAAFGMAAAPNAVAVKVHHEGEAETDKGSASTNDRVSTASRLEVEAVHVVIEEGLKNTERHTCAGKFSQRAACKSGRGRGRKLAEQCSKPGVLLQNGECAASNICESQPDDVHVQIRSHVSIGIAPMAGGTAAGKDIAEARCVDIVLLTDNDKQRLTKEEEDTCELPDLVKCQMSTEHVNSTPKHKELNTGIDKQDHSSNSSSIDCSGLNDKTMAVEHLLPPKSLTPDSNISSRGKYAHGIQKKGREAAAPLSTPWKGREMPYYADYYRGKRSGQQFRANGRNYYTKKELFCSVPPEKHRLNRSSNFLKPPGFQNHGGTYRDNYPRWRNKCTNKQTQDVHSVSSKDTFKTQPHELNKGDIGRGIKQQEGDTSQAKQLMEDARKVKQQEVNDSKADQQKAGGSSYKQHEKDERKSNYQKANDSKVNQQKTDDSKVNQQNADDSKMNQQKRDDSKVNQQKRDDSNVNQQKVDDSKGNQQKADDSKVNQQKTDDSKANQQATYGGRSKQEINESKSKQSETKASQSKHEVFDRNPQQQGAHNSKAKPEVDAIKSKQQQYDSRLTQQMTDDGKFEQVGHNEDDQQGDDSKATQHEGDDSKANQHEGDDSKANQHEGDDSKANHHEGDDSKANHHEGDDSKANQHEGDDSKANQHEGDDSKANQHEGDDSEANQHEGDDSKANQHEGDDSKAAKPKGDNIKTNKQEADSKSKQQKLHMKVNDTSKCFTARPSINLLSEMKNVGNLDSVSRYGEQQNCQLIHDTSKTPTAEAATNRLYQDASEMTERYRLVSVCHKETTPFQNVENFSTENTDNSVTLKARIGAGMVCMQEPVQETSSEFVGCNSSVHTMINAIYQSYEQATIQHDDQPAELPESNAEMQDSTGVECVPGEAPVHAQEESTLMCFISSAEKGLVAMGDESSAKEKREGYSSASMGDESSAKEKREGYTSASVQKRGDNEYVYVKKREIIKSASEGEIGDVVCASKGGRDNGLSASEQKEAIVCQGSAYTAKKKRENNNYVSEGKGELHACTSRENEDDMFYFEQKGEVVISVSEQKEVKMSASIVMGDKLRNDMDMVVNKMNYETAKINQDLENDLRPTSIIPQEISPPSCHMLDSSSQFYADLPTTVGSEHSRLCESVLSQNPLNESSTDHCAPRAPKVLPSQQIMVGQPGHSSSNVPDNFHQHISCYDISTLPGSYSGSASTDHCTPRAPTVLPSQQIMVGQPGHSRSNVPDNFHQHISCYDISTLPGSYSGSATSVNTPEGKQNSSALASLFHTRELSLPAETLGSEAAMDRMMTFLRSCSTNILQHTSQYNDNHPLDVTIAVSLTHPPLSDCVPRLPHRHDNPCLEDRSRVPCPRPVCPYPGWVPAHPSYWSWWPWFERCSPNLSTPISSTPLYSTCPPSNIHPVSSTDRGPLTSDVRNLPPSESDDSSHGPASKRANAGHICPKMCSCWNPAVFDGQQELGRTHTLTVHRSRGYWTPEMEANDPNVNAKVVEDYSMSRMQTSKNVAEEKTWNDGHSQVSSRQQTEIDSSLNLHQNHHLLGNLRTDSVALSSRSSEEPVMEEAEEPVMEEADEQSHFRQNSLRSASLRKPMRNNWTPRMTPPVASTLRKGNDGVSPSTAALTASPDSLFLRRDAAGPVTDSTSNFTCRSRGFQPASHFESQAARRKSAPYQMARPWTVAHPQSSRRKSFPSAATISSANRCSNTGKNGQLESETGSSSPSNVAANKKCVKDWALSFVARSRSYKYRFIDCHCHIDFIYSKLGVPKETYFSKFQKEHADTFPANYEGCVAIFCLPSTFSADNPQDDILKTVSMEDGIWLALGCHPKHAVEFTDSHLRGLRHMLKHPKVVALGEIGLDYSGTFRQHSEVQKHVFRQQLQLALELKLPLVIHCRDADDDCLEILTEMVPSDHKIHAHCFTRDIDVAMRWMMPFQNLFLGLTPVVTYKTALDVVNTATFIPLDRLLLETDAPFFVPHGVRSRSSHPGFALFTAERVAELKKISVDEVLKACRENTNKMYGI